MSKIVLKKKTLALAVVLGLSSFSLFTQAGEQGNQFVSHGGLQLEDESTSLGALLRGIVNPLLPIIGSPSPSPQPVDPGEPSDGNPPNVIQPKLQAWMHSDVQQAWNSGFYGQGVTITIVDDFGSSGSIRGNLGNGQRTDNHGNWVREHTDMIATQSQIRERDSRTSRNTTLGLRTDHLNVVNLSYGMMGSAANANANISWSVQERDIIDAARTGRAVIVKAAGNDGVVMGASNRSGQIDYLARDLIGAETALFAGALDKHGSVENKASIASYSNRAGSNPQVQSQFLMVGVPSNITGMAGTSFAAPQLSAYAALVGSKFVDADAKSVANRLITTARTDTINNYSRSIHGSGEASLSRALAPASIH